MEDLKKVVPPAKEGFGKDPLFEQHMAIARRIMEKRRAVLRELAK